MDYTIHAQVDSPFQLLDNKYEQNVGWYVTSLVVFCLHIACILLN